MKTGIVFDRSIDARVVEVGKNRVMLKVIAVALTRAGLFLILISLVGLGYVIWPMFRAEMKYILKWSDPEDMTGEKMYAVWNNEGRAAEKREVPTWEVPDQKYSIYIPKISANSKVISEVDVGRPDIYLQALKMGVAEAAGLSHPGQTGTTYLFAHSVGSRVDYARYNAIFYLLHRLDIGDAVELVYKQTLYKYQITGREILAENNVKYLVPQRKEEILVLSTCYPPGTSWQRLVVTAKRVY